MENIVLGEENWGGECSIGRRQSPVDLAEKASVLGRYPMLMFANYTEPMLNAKVKNTGHSRKYLIFVFYKLHLIKL